MCYKGREHMVWLNNLRQMKNESKLTTKEIAEGSGIPEPTLEKLFSGQTKAPKLPTIIQLVHFFGHSLDDLVPYEGNKKEPPSHSPGGLSQEERIFISLSPELRQEVLRYMQYLAEREDKQQ